MGIDSTKNAAWQHGQNAAATLGVGLTTAAAGGTGFYMLHKHALKLGPEALHRATPGPFLAFGAIGLTVDAVNRNGLHVSDGSGWQLAQNAGMGAVIFGALTLAAPMSHGTKQPLAISTLVNMGLGAAIGTGVHLLTRPSGD